MANSECLNISPQHQILSGEVVVGQDKIPPGGPLTMTPLIEEQESYDSSNDTCTSVTSSSDPLVKPHSEKDDSYGNYDDSTNDARTLVASSDPVVKSHNETGTENGVSGTRPVGSGTEILERDRAESEHRERKGENQCVGGPVSSTPASKSSESTLASVKKSSSFHECLGAVGSSDCDRYSVTSMASLPEGLFEGFIRHKDGSSIAVIFQVYTLYMYSTSIYTVQSTFV